VLDTGVGNEDVDGIVVEFQLHQFIDIGIRGTGLLPVADELVELRLLVAAGDLGRKQRDVLFYRLNPGQGCLHAGLFDFIAGPDQGLIVIAAVLAQIGTDCPDQLHAHHVLFGQYGTGLVDACHAIP
jgi:hypothetical protein